MTTEAPRKLQNVGQKQGDSGAWFPPAITSLQDTGLTKLNVADHVVKILYNGGDLSGHQIAEIAKLPFNGVLDGVVEFLKREKFVDTKAQTGSTGIGEASFRYTLTDKGAAKAKEAMERTSYASAAPVPLDMYLESLRAQNAERPPIRQKQLRGVMNNLVITDEMLTKVGPAVNSGKAIFLYGPPGNGKTTIAERVGEIVLGEDMWVPFAIDVNGQIIQMFDQINHQISTNPPTQKLPTGVVQDMRWIAIKRPMIMVGGELTMEVLDLVYDEINKFYEMPIHLKANGGLFLIDDFGRQQVSPVQLLNRWIVPLETRIDFMTLNNGRKIGIPFHVMTIFSTNLDPKDLVDEAFLRRIRHKIEVGNPDMEQFSEIFRIVAKVKRIPFDENGLKYLIKKWFIDMDRDFRMVHPRDIIAQMIDIASYLDVQPSMSNRELIDRAAASYFVEL
ncbi:MAG: ATP-binding protein [bacterium]|nr:ATP-binding protein [bacterium]